MNFALIYPFRRAFYRLSEFFHHWYVDGSRFLLHHIVSIYESMDETFAVKITLQHFFEPLYKDYSVIGRILGIVFRTLRASLGTAVYLVCGAFFLSVYLVWVSAPLVIIFYAFRTLY